MALGGNRMGPRKKAKYTTDSGKTIRLNMDADIKTASGLPDSAAGDVTKPLGFKPRGVWCQRAANQAPDGAGTGEGVTYIARKFIPCAADATFYKTDEAKTLTIDGEVYTITGRVGEKQSFI